MTSYSHAVPSIAPGRTWLGRLWWNMLYVLGQTPWDTGLTPPAVRAAVESGQIKPGRVLDLGCGTGDKVIYLAQHGFEVVGVDLSSRAIAQAQRKIRQAGLGRHARVYVGDVTRLDSLPIDGLFELVLDIGCLHTLDASAHQDYANGVIKRVQPDGLYMLYAFIPCVQYGWRLGISSQEVKALFPSGQILQESHGPCKNAGGVGAVWYTFSFSARVRSVTN